MSAQETQTDEQATLDALRETAITATIAWLEEGDRLGRNPQVLAMEFMGAFSQAAEKVLG